MMLDYGRPQTHETFPTHGLWAGRVDNLPPLPSFLVLGFFHPPRFEHPVVVGLFDPFGDQLLAQAFPAICFRLANVAAQ